MAADSVGLRAASKATQQTVRHPKLNRAERMLIKPTNLRLKRKATAFRSRSTLCTKLLPSPFRPCRSLKRTRSSARAAINRRVDGKGGNPLVGHLPLAIRRGAPAVGSFRPRSSHLLIYGTPSSGFRAIASCRPDVRYGCRTKCALTLPLPLPLPPPPRLVAAALSSLALASLAVCPLVPGIS